MMTRWSDWGFDPGFGELDRTLAEFDLLRREMNRLFDGGLGHERGRARGSSWPRVSVHDQGGSLLLRAELPGVSDKDLAITLDQGIVTLKGERRASVPEGYSVHRQERADVTFARSFSLPCKIDRERAKADLKDGVLTLELPKAAEEQPRRIAVKAS
jgi:HSP20 family protein